MEMELMSIFYSKRHMRQVASRSVYYREMVWQGQHTMIAVNLSGSRVAAEWNFPRPVQAAVLFENRAMPESAEQTWDVFEPWGVHVYQWK